MARIIGQRLRYCIISVHVLLIATVVWGTTADQYNLASLRDLLVLFSSQGFSNSPGDEADSPPEMNLVGWRSAAQPTFTRAVVLVGCAALTHPTHVCFQSGRARLRRAVLSRNLPGAGHLVFQDGGMTASSDT